MCIGHARLSVYLSVPRRIPTLLHGPGRNLGEGMVGRCPLVAHYWADMQPVHGFPVELSFSSTTQSGHHLRTVQTTAEGTPFSGSMNTMALCDSDMRRLRRTLTYLLTYCDNIASNVSASACRRCMPGFVLQAARRLVVCCSLSGGELFDQVADDDYKMTEAEVIRYVRQVCEGLQHMHEQNIVHLDVKVSPFVCLPSSLHFITETIHYGRPM